MSALRSMLERAEARLGQVQAGADVIIIRGGLTQDSSGDLGYVGSEFVERRAGETADEFRLRASMMGRARREQVILGGLPPMPVDDGL